jgi:DNA invertase Pin-like site-specific DNA recombinase
MLLPLPPGDVSPEVSAQGSGQPRAKTVEVSSIMAQEHAVRADCHRRDAPPPWAASPAASGMPTALYLRGSTSHPQPDLQAEALRCYAASAGLAVVAEYVDGAGAGPHAGCPQLHALMRAARQQRFTCVVVWQFDCLARSVSQLLSVLAEWQQLGLRFMSVQDQVDTACLGGQTLVTIMAATAAFVAALRSEHTKAGMVAAQARGKRLGRPATPSALVAQVETLAQTTEMSIRQIQQALAGRVSRSAVGQIVKRVRAAGEAGVLGPGSRPGAGPS